MPWLARKFLPIRCLRTVFAIAVLLFDGGKRKTWMHPSGAGTSMLTHEAGKHFVPWTQTFVVVAGRAKVHSQLQPLIIWPTGSSALVSKLTWNFPNPDSMNFL